MANMYYCPNCSAIVSAEEGATAAKCGTCGYQFPIYNPVTFENMEGSNAGEQFSYEQQSGAGTYNEPAVENFNLITAYRSFFKKYVQFKGRSRRSEFWFALLANYIVMMVLYILMMVAVTPTVTRLMMNETVPVGGMVLMSVISIVISVYSFAILIPGIAMCVRRLHDTGRSGWSYFFCLIPAVGGIILLIFLASDSQPGANQYGPNPKGL